MARRKFSPGEIVERLREIEALTEDGRSVAEAMRLAGVLPDEYDEWRREYSGLVRTLGPLACASPRLMKKPRRPGSVGPVGTAK
ncbi:MAG TPA: hypothetical protein VFE63_05800 [Roseiarcus sp.]|jgi:hypothetical protein|nr:hypothetical protein [Roseiarcus sp.]